MAYLDQETVYGQIHRVGENGDTVYACDGSKQDGARKLGGAEPRRCGSRRTGRELTLDRVPCDDGVVDQEAERNDEARYSDLL